MPVKQTNPDDNRLPKRYDDLLNSPDEQGTISKDDGGPATWKRQEDGSVVITYPPTDSIEDHTRHVQRTGDGGVIITDNSTEQGGTVEVRTEYDANRQMRHRSITNGGTVDTEDFDDKGRLSHSHSHSNSSSERFDSATTDQDKTYDDKGNVLTEKLDGATTQHYDFDSDTVMTRTVEDHTTRTRNPDGTYSSSSSHSVTLDSKSSDGSSEHRKTQVDEQTTEDAKGNTINGTRTTTTTAADGTTTTKVETFKDGNWVDVNDKDKGITSKEHDPALVMQQIKVLLGKADFGAQEHIERPIDVAAALGESLQRQMG